jgi:hypothetical protein
MKPRSEYQRTIEYFIPIAECPEDPDECWELHLAMLKDVHAQYPDAGITVTKHPTRKSGVVLPGETVRRLDVTGDVDRSAVLQLLEESERANKHH